MSDAEPAAKPAMRCTGRAGYVSANAMRVAAGSAAAPAASLRIRRRERVMAFPSFVAGDASVFARQSLAAPLRMNVVRSNDAQSVIEPPPSTYQAVPTT